MRRRSSLKCFIAIAAGVKLNWPHVARASDEYPSRPIRIVMPLTAGTAWDVRVRQIAEMVAKSMGATVVVENRPGAGATIAATAVARAAPDGYTLLAATQADQSIARVVYANLQYDPEKDFAPVTQILAGTPILVVGADVPAKTFAELVALAKKSPGQLTAASYGYGTYTHLIIAELARASGIDVVHVPYKSGGEALKDVVAGRVTMMVDFYTTSGPYIQNGKLHPIIAVAPKRIRVLPKLPTTLELGMPRIARRSWGGIVAPAGTPAKIVSRLNLEFAKASRSPAFKQVIEENGGEIIASSPEDFQLFLRRDRDEYQRLVKEIGIKIE